MSTLQFLRSDCRALFERHGLASFDKLWALETPWFEPPNYRRKGWSGIVRIELEAEDGDPRAFFLKRQENHNYLTPDAPIRGRPTVYRELHYAARLKRAGIPTYEVFVYGEGASGGDTRALLGTMALHDHATLDDWLESPAAAESALREEVVRSVAAMVKKLHRSGFQHGCLYGKHIMVHVTKADIDLRLVDLEKIRSSFLRLTVPLQDLDQFFRHISPAWQPRDSLVFLETYCGEQRIRSFAGRLRRRVVRKDPGRSDLLDL